ncbi:hypothetical protein [Desertivirga xinjiangensis]|uniref:hypothetical protein n=1 Tax=Desertivirga xinjiangensis TaxID=539206 RepID=UPI00210937E3|nr:hypothetical protein [Pedobacter xinjiangensis]
MKSIFNLLKGISNNGILSIDRVQKHIQELDAEREESLRLLKRCKQDVGMYLGEEIQSHIATMEGKHFSAKDYHYERPVGEQ